MTGVYVRVFPGDDGQLKRRIMVLRNGRAFDLRHATSRPLSFYDALPGRWEFLREDKRRSEEREAL